VMRIKEPPPPPFVRAPTTGFEYRVDKQSYGPMNRKSRIMLINTAATTSFIFECEHRNLGMAKLI
jgi:hypothetical protein